MRLAPLAVLGFLALSPAAVAQEDVGSTSSSGLHGGSMATLLSKGYEIKAAVANGTRYIVFMQKDQSAYACEFVTLTKSRCGSIN
ncbi:MULTISPECIES: hypothetical protein [Sinorhizobium]|jgi:hypothetical protein|uniref:Uncharacterized protein n=3 Tax=Sinorhizobium TaxID=28105 RepID=A0A2A6LZ01_RHIFR|nr:MULTISPECIES: hypothetical protein [Sinorhizobium]ASY68422.1 hypothetical protein SF83666_c09870 [Sinorhizobium fredii CCBAU 83666]AWI56690.1 hypothetical protein AB395_00001017 [Sinorhizobium fredii CCBAU 45436]AWM24491.1 hypothetical protein AOX55_00001219 [Sinorhizobium fredii CCBAU 25509]KSV90347.1 signal peptide protein [Sinorhizobium fredii USDA 205]MCG5477383.1 hypothetical protein [Sinorhizobium fredii]